MKQVSSSWSTFNQTVNNSFYLCLYKDHTTEGHCEPERLELVPFNTGLDMW